MCLARNREAGFTLVELAIVLVIIGLIVGGVLVGRQLIQAAEIRSQITQIQDFNAAVNTFRVRYGALPGDMADPAATRFGLEPRGQFRGQGDGNRVLEGVTALTAAGHSNLATGTGETAVFWKDLSRTGLVKGAFNAASNTVLTPSLVLVNGSPNVGDFLPEAKVSPTSYVYVWSRGRFNYFGLSQVAAIGLTPVQSLPGVTVSQAYGIDAKVDDGRPDTGRVQAEYVNTNVRWTLGYTFVNTGPIHPANRFAVPSSPTSCFDNGNVNQAQYAYSTAENDGGNTTCGLSFQMQ